LINDDNEFVIKFRKQVLTKLLGFTLGVFLSSYYLLDDNESSLILIIGSALIFIFAYKLIAFFDEVVRELHQFGIRLKNGTAKKSSPKDRSNDSIQEYLQSVYQKEVKAQQRSRSQFTHLKTIIQHIEIGLISFDNIGKIHIFNNAAKQLLKCPQQKNIDELKNISNTLVEHFTTLKTGGRTLVKIEQEDEIIQLSIFAIELQYEELPVKLITLQNLQTELEQNEMEAWKKLVRVLTHEIMNSVTPITSLSQTMEEEIDMLTQQDDLTETCQDSLDDIMMAVQTIGRRGKGLINFVNDFKNITHIPKPTIKTENLYDLLNEIKMLHQAELEMAGVDLKIALECEEPIVEVDKDQISQVFINLIKNAIQAMEVNSEHKLIEVLIKDNSTHDAVHVHIKDNGKGIDEEALSRIFVPFFTTKKEGSGIGLSLSKQIIRQHFGSISAKSHLGVGTEFTIRLRKEILMMMV